MYFFPDIEVNEKPLGIPYLREDETSHSFVDLRQNPGAIDDLPEPKKRQPLYEFVKAINEPSSQFQTFGCETWEQPWTHPNAPGIVTRVGSYVDIAFANLSLCRNQLLLRSLIKQYQKYGHQCIEYNGCNVEFELRLTVGEPGQWWTLEFWNYGIGRNSKEAEHWWAEGMRCFQTFLVSRPETISALEVLIATRCHLLAQTQ
jgi:hypothetical protein